MQTQTLSDTQQSTTALVEAAKLKPGSVVIHNGVEMRVRRVVPALWRSSGCHVHLLPMDYEALEGVSQSLVERYECTALVRVPCVANKPFQVVQR
jgi:hypothetical protein